jgi:hypothetical protein
MRKNHTMLRNEFKTVDPDKQLLSFAEEMLPFHNHLGIVDVAKIARLIGVHGDQSDHYYRLVGLTPDGVQEYFSSAVGQFESLKGKIDSYEYLDEMLSTNGAKPSEEFSITADDASWL